MSKQLVRVGIQKIKDPDLRIVAPFNLLIEFIHEVRSATRLPITRTRKSFNTLMSGLIQAVRKKTA